MSLDRTRQGWLLLLGAVLIAAAFHQLGAEVYAGWALELGTVWEPRARHLLFLVFFTFAAVLVVPLVATGLLRAFGDRKPWPEADDRWFLARAVIAGILIPAALRLLVFGNVHVTDDEPVYRFAAELLLQGRVTMESHPMRLFFDHAFMVNDGEMYSQYFLGWPAFLSVGVALGAPGFVNAVLSGLTVLPLYRLVKELTDRTWAQVVTLLFLLSPMLQLMAATELSHTSALFALTWTAWLAHRAVAEPERWGPPALLGLAFSVAFFIRPLTALGIGGPFLVFWGLSWWRSERRLAPVAAFLGPTVVLASLFLLVNQLQTGSALKPAYMAWDEYSRENAFRFSARNPDTAPEVPNLAFTGDRYLGRTIWVGLLRLNYALLGWPTAFLFVPLALAVRRSGVLWASAGIFLFLHLPLYDPGIDTFGPVHFAELALPVLVLSALGLQRVSRWIDAPGWSPGDLPDEAEAPGRPPSVGRRVVLATVAGLLFCTVTLYAPVRLRAASVAGTLAGIPGMMLERAGLEDAVVFSTIPWTVACNPAIPVPSRPFVFWWPVNEPGFTDEVLHANHLSVARDRALMEEYFPERSGWILRWTDQCTLELIPLNDPAAETVPNGIMLATNRRVIRYDESHPPTGEVPPGFSP